MNRPKSLCLVLGLVLAGPLFARLAFDDDVILIEPGFHHLGNDATPEWPEAPAAPTAGSLELRFEAPANPAEQVLSLRQRSVNARWALVLNGTELASLELHEDQRECFYPVPAGLLHKGVNSLLLVPDIPGDDITVGDVRLHSQPLRELFDLAPLRVSVSDEDGSGLPARVTITDARGERVHIWSAHDGQAAVREGLVYTTDTGVTLELPRGEYVVHASRGTEWSHDQVSVRVGASGATSSAAEREAQGEASSAAESTAKAATPGAAEGPVRGVGGAVRSEDEGLARAALSLRREVATPGFIAADTHIHTLTFSGHGDASLTERMLTLAGEGVELAVATDHNHNTDYGEEQQALGLERWFTPLTGNEVTTPNGHFNAFPLRPEDQVPLHDSSDWVALVEDMRAKGALAVILNHPRWPAKDTGPFGVFDLDEFTGARRATGTRFDFDAMELVNSTTRTPDPMLLFHDWFALLNRGERIMAVGSSDSHTVGDPVGRGRTYVRSKSDDPASLDSRELALNIAEGHSSVSLGMFIDVRVEGRSAMGHTLYVDDQVVDMQVRVAAPSWVHPEHLMVFIDGEVAADRTLSPPIGEAADLLLPMSFEVAHGHDMWLVVAVFGPPAGGVWWPGLNEYTLAAANPLLLDVDGDGAWQSPREVALARWKGAPADLDLVDADQAVVLQYLDLAEQYYQRQARTRLERLGQGQARRDARVREYLEQRTAEPGTR